MRSLIVISLFGLALGQVIEPRQAIEPRNTCGKYTPKVIIDKSRGEVSTMDSDPLLTEILGSAKEFRCKK